MAAFGIVALAARYRCHITRRAAKQTDREALSDNQVTAEHPAARSIHCAHAISMGHGHNPLPWGHLSVCADRHTQPTINSEQISNRAD
jgi:hypothetical protein